MRAALALCALPIGCTYGPPRYQGEIQHAALIGDGRVAIGYHQSITRPPTGISTFPDGGAPLTLRDVLLLATVDPDGRTREIFRTANKALPGTGSISVAWHEQDPGHLYYTIAGQRSRQPYVFSDHFRMNLADGRSAPDADLPTELGRLGRSYPAKDFGGERFLGPDGSRLVGAMHGVDKEIWLRDGAGALRLLDRFDQFEDRFGDELVYIKGELMLVRNWRTGAVRPVIRWNPSRSLQVWRAEGDPILDKLKHSVLKPNDQVWPSADRKGVVVQRGNRAVRELRLDPKIVDRL
jgi:hypothetical protein